MDHQYGSWAKEEQDFDLDLPERREISSLAVGL